MMRASALLLLLATVANAECPNACSGHGTCGRDDICTCFQNWQSGDEASGDCSDRTCPYDMAWADVATDVDEAHGYLECSGRGTCDRKTGHCSCFDGYTGAACKRTTCPNDCSGHGTCEFISDVFPTTERGEFVHLTHKLLGKVWDADKSRTCVCDPKWTDVDCSRRMCPKGNDPLLDCAEKYNTPKVQKQRICFFAADDRLLGGDFAIKYNDYYGGSYTTRPLAFDATADDIADALLSLPDHAIDAVSVVSTEYAKCVTHTNEKIAALTAERKAAGDTDAEIVAAMAAAFGSTGGHGWTITLSSHQVTGKQHHFELLTQECGDGCQPKLAGLTSLAHFVTILESADTEMYECSRRGACDYDTGICECFKGFTDEDCSVQSNLA